MYQPSETARNLRAEYAFLSIAEREVTQLAGHSAARETGHCTRDTSPLSEARRAAAKRNNLAIARLNAEARLQSGPC